MVNTAGQVIGMDTAGGGSGFSFGGAGASRGYAIPIDHATSLAAKIVAGQRSSTIHIGATPFLGVNVPPPSGLFGRGGGSPLTVAEVVPGSPSSRAGLVPTT